VRPSVRPLRRWRLVLPFDFAVEWNDAIRFHWLPWSCGPIHGWAWLLWYRTWDGTHGERTWPHRSR